MEQMMDAKIQAVYKCLVAFELRVLERPAPTIDVTTFQTELVRLRVDVDELLTLVVLVLDTAPEVEEDEVVMFALFGDSMPPPDTSCTTGKCHRSSEHTSDTDEAQWVRKRERGDLVAAQRQSIVDEEMRKQRAREIGVGPSGSKSTIEGIPTVDEGTTDGVPIADPAGSGKPDQPVS
uniref:Integrase core domain containing protein n=1 Tax=Solanum tuberosum TaxID=4113 RepID=M1DYI7_SOLTU